jgi:hypothetical protein
MAVTEDGAYPRSLSDLGMAQLTKCPVTGQAYKYDPATGTVKCPSHPRY